MKKAYSFLFLCVFFCKNADAQMDVRETFLSSATYKSIQLPFNASINLSTAVVSGIGELSGRRQIDVCNNDGTTVMWCGFDVGVSTLTTSAYQGRRIGTTSCVDFKVGEDIDVYCFAESASSFSRTTVIQFR